MPQAQDTSELYVEIYRVTKDLAELSAGELVDENDLDRLQNLLVKRQEIMAKVGGRPTSEVRPVLEKIAALDNTLRQNILERRDNAKGKLKKIHTSKLAGRTYSQLPQQREGYFVDTR